MSKTLRWVFVLLPCTPGLVLLLAGVVLVAFTHDERNAARIGPLFTAGGAVLVAGLGIGAFVAWRIAHPRPDDTEDEETKDRPPTE